MRLPQYSYRALPLRFLAAWMVMVGPMLSKFGESVLPTEYLFRPLVVATIVAVGVAILTGWWRRFGVLIAVGAAIVLTDATLGLLYAAAVGIIGVLAARRGVSREATVGTTLVVVAYFAVAGVSAAPVIDLDLDRMAAAESDREVFLVLLDSYPRVDTLEAIGIDINDFITSLEARGFDHYPDAESEQPWTHLLLTAMLAGDLPPIERDSNQLRRTLRESWDLPAEWQVVEPPVGDVTIPSAPAIHAAGMNNFEAYLVGKSILGRTPLGGGLVMDGLRSRLEEAVRAVSDSERSKVFAHLDAPHPPFLYQADGSPASPPDCWPDCQIFSALRHELGISADEWAAAQTGNLAHLNALLLEMVDEIIARNPNAVIVLFSDHGSRYHPEIAAEAHRVLLVARTPGQPRLFGEAPHVAELLRNLEVAY